MFTVKDKEPEFIVRNKTKTLLSSRNTNTWNLEELIDNWLQHNMIKGLIEATGVDVNAFLKDACKDYNVPFEGTSIIFTDKWIKEAIQGYKIGCGILHRNHEKERSEQFFKVVGLVKKTD